MAEKKKQPGNDSFSVRLTSALSKKKDDANTSVDAAAANSATPVKQPPATSKQRTPDADSFTMRLTNQVKVSATAEKRTPPPRQTSLYGSSPVGAGDHIVREGECIASIANEAGHLWTTVWDDAENADLRAARQDPNVLLAGDRVHIPPIENKLESGETELRHRFIRRREPANITITLRDKQGNPRANESFSLNVDGEVTEGYTDPNGVLRAVVAPTADTAWLTLPDAGESYPLRLARLQPAAAAAGAQGRLNNIGFNCGTPGKVWTARARAALQLFQARYGLPATGEYDVDTRAKLEAAHGS